ncbi:hypothetical protein EMGBS10_01580 [Opitutia bacterium]|nr:hypothetical protein EMGBS10_01580 [Opitutae bacterium]
MDPAADKSVSPTWLRRYHELKAYAARHGDCNLRPDTPGYGSLGSWVAGNAFHGETRRNSRPPGPGCLTKIGFLWHLKEPPRLQHFRGMVSSSYRPM